ncbi:hypothetical protein EU799_07400 [Corynebacterium silvaticum]|uniref:glycine-rich domain-containing protein n=1 Tax=Corynebacterium silvaticum TaxID=2320431 RepID=UPI0010681708|nr:hypothetical protein [Corynebacterium silvaticum]MBH5300907.1 hypothetical protein [Corynebacterium silvaticum]NOM65105.1 hypothetical protein [Corynebacterium silvaticum]TFA91662.1 hypothetical protein EU802_10185 [Corynebacterium silvaticum]TFA95427.1 hypothetical protein EU799_07400 [Corynebacterium silvaticum]TRM15184.1 hypothetical protein ET810_008375 [Corynebacterium silvaticum]
MPVIQGKLSTVTKQPSGIREVWLRPAATRPGGGGLIVDEPVRITVDERGEFSVDVAVGAAVLVLIGADFTARESIPMLVHEGTATLRQAVEDAKDFTPEVADKLAELADQVARGVKTAGEAATAAATDREKAEKSATAAKESASVASQKESAASSAWQQLKDRLAQWEPRVQQLDAWQPQYEWLKDNAERSFSVVQEKITQATQQVISQVKGDAEAVKRDAATAGQHSLKAQAAANTAESVTNRVVESAINKLLDGASQAYDTLKEVADELVSQKSAAAVLMKQLSEKASVTELSALRQKVESLAISGVSGLSQALAGKANTSHTHRTSEITGLGGEINELKSSLSQKVDRDDVVGVVEKSRKVEQAWDYARRALAGILICVLLMLPLNILRLTCGISSGSHKVIFVGGKAIKSITVGAVQVQEVYRGGVLVWRNSRQPEVHEFRQPGHYVIFSPSWAKFMDFVLIAGGGGGACGDNSWGRLGNGGGAGQVTSGTQPLLGRVQFKVTVGAGGGGGLSWDDRNGRAGGESSVNGGGITGTAVGGGGGSGFGGAAAGVREQVKVDGFYAPAGSPAGVDTPGMTPGDGGGGGTGGILGKFNPGQSGADGLAWIRFRRS